MKYYKIIQDNRIIGAVSSKNFIRYISLSNCFTRCDESIGEYISYNGNLYRDVWMHPTSIDYKFIEVRIIPIEKDEYTAYHEAINNNAEIEIILEEEPEPIKHLEDPIETASLEFIRESKIREMSQACRKTIEHGFDLEIQGKLQHFSLSAQDQLNLMNLSIMAQSSRQIPYHADGEDCTFYTTKEINKIVSAANNFKIYNTTYYNALKKYINALKTIKEISAIQYGIDIPEEYKTNVLKSLE